MDCNKVVGRAAAAAAADADLDEEAVSAPTRLLLLDDHNSNTRPITGKKPGVETILLLLVFAGEGDTAKDFLRL